MVSMFDAIVNNNPNENDYPSIDKIPGFDSLPPLAKSLLFKKVEEVMMGNALAGVSISKGDIRRGAGANLAKFRGVKGYGRKTIAAIEAWLKPPK